MKQTRFVQHNVVIVGIGWRVWPTLTNLKSDQRCIPKLLWSLRSVGGWVPKRPVPHHPLLPQCPLHCFRCVPSPGRWATFWPLSNWQTLIELLDLPAAHSSISGWGAVSWDGSFKTHLIPKKEIWPWIQEEKMYLAFSRMIRKGSVN